LDRRTHNVLIDSVPVTLTPIEFDLLATLMRSPGRVFSRDELVTQLTDSGFAGLESTLNVHVRNLRMKIEKDPGKPCYVETVFGIGYRFHREPEIRV
jgi:DNA-binding response OmpR family regulator